MPDDRSKEIFLTHFRENKDRVYDYALRMTGDAHEAGDISQEVFIRFFEKRRELPEIRNTGAWLIAITRNLCLNHLRDRKQEVPLENIDTIQSFDPHDQHPNYAILEKAMAALKTKYREALILKEYQGFSYEEISEIMQTTVSAVRSLLFNARIKLSENFHRINNGRLL